MPLHRCTIKPWQQLQSFGAVIRKDRGQEAFDEAQRLANFKEADMREKCELDADRDEVGADVQAREESEPSR